MNTEKNWHYQGNNLGGCRSCYCAKCELIIALSPQSRTLCQQTFPCCTVCLVWLALGAREIPYEKEGGEEEFGIHLLHHLQQPRCLSPLPLLHPHPGLHHLRCHCAGLHTEHYSHTAHGTLYPY